MRVITLLLLVLFIGGGGYYLYHHGEDLKAYIGSQIDSEQFLTIEPHFSASQIMAAHQADLITAAGQSYQPPGLKFYPFLLLEISYSAPDHKPVDTVLLWSLADGELITDTDSWSSTQGFEDLISHDATAGDYKIVKALAANQGTMTRDQLQTFLSVSPHTIDDWIQDARQKQLISQRGNQFTLTQKNLNIDVQPLTRINQWLSTKPYSHAQREPSRFSAMEIEKAIHSAFGNNLTIRSAMEVYLPIYNIGVATRDGTVRTTAWNALNGQPLKPTGRLKGRAPTIFEGEGPN